MSDRVNLQDFVGAFVAEADELVVASRRALLEIETANAAGTSRPRAVRDLFRALHTIKGLAGMIGIEPIVEVAHALETLVRNAERGGGVLRRAAVDVSLQGVAAIGERVRAVADGHATTSVPARLLEAIAAIDAGGEAAAEPAMITPAWDAKLGPGERQQLAAALAAGTPAWTVTFVPSEANAANGTTIASVRARLGEIGEIVKVIPRATPEHASNIAFDILLVSDGTPGSIAAAAATSVDHVIALVATPAPVPEGAGEHTEPLDEAPALGRALVRVDLARLDELQDQLSLMIVSRFRLERELAALAANGHDVRRLREVAELQARQLRDLRRAILRARMVRVAEVLEPLSLLVRGLARSAQKDVQLDLDVRDAELDKAVADRLLPALVHLVRNSVDHAIEMPDERVAKGKPRCGTVRVTCTDVAGRLEVVVEDDGRGIDRVAIARRANRTVDDDHDLLAVLTTPGFSTRDVATRTSGRGLGMDIVKRIAVDVLGGELSLASTLDVGTRFTLIVPLTIAVTDVFAFECGRQEFVVPVTSIDEIFELPPEQGVQPPFAASATSIVRMLEWRGHAVPLLSLGAVLAIDGAGDSRKAMVTRRGGEQVAFAVDRMLGRHEVVVRPVDDPLVRVPGVTGSTDLGSGRPTLVLDLGALALERHAR